MTFISGFLETILNGLKVLNSFRILKSTPLSVMSMIAVMTMKKSNLDHGSFKYAFFPMIKPFAMIFRTDSRMKMQLNAISIRVEIFEIGSSSSMYVSITSLMEDSAIIKIMKFSKYTEEVIFIATILTQFVG